MLCSSLPQKGGGMTLCSAHLAHGRDTDGARDLGRACARALGLGLSLSLVLALALPDILGKVHIHISRPQNGLGTVIKRCCLAVGAPNVSPTANLAVGAPITPTWQVRGTLRY